MSNATRVGSDGISYERETRLLAETGAEFNSLLALPAEDQLRTFREYGNPVNISGEEDLAVLFKSMWGRAIAVARDYYPRHAESHGIDMLSKASAFCLAMGIVAIYEEHLDGERMERFKFSRDDERDVLTEVERKLSSEQFVSSFSEILGDSIANIVDETSVLDDEIAPVTNHTKATELEEATEEPEDIFKKLDNRRKRLLLDIFGDDGKEILEGINELEALILADRLCDLYLKGSKNKSEKRRGTEEVDASIVIGKICGIKSVDLSVCLNISTNTSNRLKSRFVPSLKQKIDTSLIEEAQATAKTVEDPDECIRAILEKYGLEAYFSSIIKPGQSKNYSKNQAVATESPWPSLSCEIHEEVPVELTDDMFTEIIQKVTPMMRFVRSREVRAVAWMFSPRIKARDRDVDLGLGVVQGDVRKFLDFNQTKPHVSDQDRLSPVEVRAMEEVLLATSRYKKEDKMPVQQAVDKMVAQSKKDLGKKVATNLARRIIASSLLKLGYDRETSS